MTIRYPPRREPRVLAIGQARTGLAFATADPWVVRSAGHIDCGPRSRLSALVRLIRREKPTALIPANASLRRTLRRVGRAQGIPVLTEPLPHLPRAVASELYPELPLMAPGHLSHLASIAVSAILSARVPPRTYVPRRHHTPARRAQ